VIAVSLGAADVFADRARIDVTGLVHYSIEVRPALGSAGDEACPQAVT
jgi:hypothetical protein